MIPKRPVITVDLFPEERARLIELLGALSPAQWEAPTSCPGWSVKDIAAHILGDDLNNLSGGRDGDTSSWFEVTGWEDLLALINERNQDWVDAMRRLSPRVLLELLAFCGERAQAYYRSLDLMALGPNVGWAGTGAMPMWLHVAREYTERWLHQMQIREAVGAPGLYERRLFFPVLDTFVHALPVAYAAVETPDGLQVTVEITGDAGSAWSLFPGDGRWQLCEGASPIADATVRLDQDLAWRLWTKGTDPEAARDRVTFEGDSALCEPVLHAVSIVA